MDMYARLREVNNAMLYKQKFSEKYEKCARTSEKLTKQKNALENEISVLKKEIYYIAIIRKEYADGSVDYETSFTDIEDFNESYYCILKCIGKEVGIATDNPKVLTYACVIRGKEEIEKELLHGNDYGKLVLNQKSQNFRQLHTLPIFGESLQLLLERKNERVDRKFFRL